jgi:hypothetical protein
MLARCGVSAARLGYRASPLHGVVQREGVGGEREGSREGEKDKCRKETDKQSNGSVCSRRN